MATKQQKTTYTVAEVAVLEETILKQKDEIEELKRKLDHMKEIFARKIPDLPGSLLSNRLCLL